MYRFKKYKAMTLVEILTVLCLIGVVASATVPILFNDSREAEYKTKFVKMYQTLARVHSQIKSENGGSLYNLCSNNNTNCLAQKYRAKMNVAKYCVSPGRNGAECWFPAYTVKNFKRGAGGVLGSFEFIGMGVGEASMQLEDGTKILFQGFTSGAAATYIWVDVNGSKGPNRMGFDVFMLYSTASKLYPYSTGNCPNDLAGANCGELVIQGIDYAYPN